MSILFEEFLRFLVVGALCMALNLVLLYGFTDVLGIHYLLSCVIVVLLVNGVGFLLNRRFTFFSGQARFIYGSLQGFFHYNVVSVISFFMVIVQMYVMVDWFGLWYVHANILSGIVMAFFNFFMHRKITYVRG